FFPRRPLLQAAPAAEAAGGQLPSVEEVPRMRSPLIASIALTAVFGVAAFAQDGAVAPAAGDAEERQAIEELRQLAGELFEPIPSMVPAVEGNPVTREKVELGKMLWFD